MFRRVLLAAAAFLCSAVPVSAQTATPSTMDNGPSLLWVWLWILVAGIAIFIVGTSLGANKRR